MWIEMKRTNESCLKMAGKYWLYGSVGQEISPNLKIVS